MTTFADRADAVTTRLADLNLGALVPAARDAAVTADRSVDDTVDRVRSGLVPAVDYDELATELVHGRLKPETAGKRLTAPAGARTSNLLDAVHRAAVKAADRPEFSPRDLRRSVVDELQARLKRTADDMLSTVKAAPAVVRDRLTATVDTDSGTLYGPAGTDQLVDALDWIAPTGDLSSVRPDDLAAVQRLQAAWSWFYGDADYFAPLYWLGTGVEPTAAAGWLSTGYSGPAGEAADTFAPALLLVDGDAVDWIAAGVPFAYVVAAGLVDHFAPIADPFGDDGEEYARRAERFAAFRSWRDAYRNMAAAGAAYLVDPRERARLRDRRDRPAHVQVQAFRAEHGDAA